MKLRGTTPLIGTLLGIVGFFAAVFVLGNIAGLAVGLCIFLACAAISRRIWQREASAEEIRRDLEDRAHTPP